MIVDGRGITKELLRSEREKVEALGRPVTVRAVSVAPSPATESYLRVKERRARQAGMVLEIVRLPDSATTDEVITALQSPADALLVQLPLPDHIDSTRVLDAIPLSKDADVLSFAAHEAFESGEGDALLPPVVAAVSEVLARSGVDVRGTHAVVIGSGWLVGEPAAAWLRQSGAEVIVITKESGAWDALKTADIVVSGAGSPGLITPEKLSPGVVLIDAGTSESGGSIVGDADPACADVASVFTPVPGGIGPIAVACLFRNARILAERGRLQGDAKAV